MSLCGKHLDGSYFVCFVLFLFFTQSDIQCLLIGGLSPFTFRVITDRYEFSAIVLLVKSLFLEISSVPFQSTGRVLLRVPFKVSCRACLAVTNSFTLCLPGKLFNLFYSELQPCWIEYFKLHIFPIQHIKYIMPLPSVPPNFCG